MVVDGENHVFFSVKKEGNLELDRDDEYKTSFKIKPNKEGFTWHVFDIVKGDQIVPKEKISTKKLKITNR